MGGASGSMDGKEAKSSGFVSDKTADDAQFIRVHLPGPVPKGGQTRIRIIKTYTDAASYYLKDGQLVFDRPHRRVIACAARTTTEIGRIARRGGGTGPATTDVSRGPDP